MESTFARVEKYCSNQLIAYSKCVGSESFSTECLEKRRALTKCAHENVDSLRLAKEKCAPFIKKYQDCHDANLADSSKCSGFLQELYDCHGTI